MEENINFTESSLENKSDLLKSDSLEDHSYAQAEDVPEDEDLMRINSFREDSRCDSSEATGQENHSVPNERKIRKIVSITTDSYKYIGEILNNKKDGFGICYYTNGDLYIGEWRENFKDGWGKLKKGDVIYQGELTKNSFNGYCEKITNNDTLIGFCVNGIYVGQIVKTKKKKTIEMTIGEKIYKEIFNENQYYIGEENIALYYNEGKTIIGNMTKSNLNGYGEVYYKDGSKFFGNFINHRKQGFGIILSKDGKTYTMGYFIDDLKNGPMFVVTANTFKIELYILGFKAKIVDKYENCKNYLKLNYPEYCFMLKLDHKHLMNVFITENL